MEDTSKINIGGKTLLLKDESGTDAEPILPSHPPRQQQQTTKPPSLFPPPQHQQTTVCALVVLAVVLISVERTVVFVVVDRVEVQAKRFG